MLKTLALATILASATASANDDMFAQVFTDWLIVAQDGVAAQDCARDIQSQTGFEIRQVLEISGIIVATSPTADGSALAQVSCVKAYERDGIAFPM